MHEQNISLFLFYLRLQNGYHLFFSFEFGSNEFHPISKYMLYVVNWWFTAKNFWYRANIICCAYKKPNSVSKRKKNNIFSLSGTKQNKKNTKNSVECAREIFFFSW